MGKVAFLHVYRRTCGICYTLDNFTVVNGLDYVCIDLDRIPKNHVLHDSPKNSDQLDNFQDAFDREWFDLYQTKNNQTSEGTETGA
jgi:hypothetical protein